MGKFLIAGIIQRETTVKVSNIPIEYSRVTKGKETVFRGVGGDAYNMTKALKWLGDDVDLLSMIGNDDAYLIEKHRLNPDYVLTSLDETPLSVIFFDRNRKQQIFDDWKDIEQAEYDIKLFERSLDDTDIVILSNANFCRPFLAKVKEKKKKLVVNFHGFQESTDKEFLEAADIIYVSDDEIGGEPFEAIKELGEKYPAECIIIGLGKSGLLMYTRNDNMVVPYSSVHIKEVINTVGAGNALLSCFVHYYQKTNDYHESVKYALLFAAYKIGYIGTSKGFMTEEEMEQWYDLIWNRYK